MELEPYTFLDAVFRGNVRFGKVFWAHQPVRVTQKKATTRKFCTVRNKLTRRTRPLLQKLSYRLRLVAYVLR